MLISLNPSWHFTLDNPEGVELPDFDDSGMPVVHLPHDWQIEQKKDKNIEYGVAQGYYPGNHLGWYRKRLFVPEEWRGKIVTLSFDGVQRFSAVYCNGVRVGGHAYGYVPFDCDLTDHLRYGEENLIAVKVDNTDIEPDRWYSGAGIYRNVCLHIQEPLSFFPRGVILLPHKDGEAWRCTLKADLQNQTGFPKDAQILVELWDKDKLFVDFRQSVRVKNGASDTEFCFPVPTPHLWDTEDPYLYHVRVTLATEDSVSDVFETKIGFRTAVFDDDRGFFLNGRSVKLYGGNFHHDGGGFGAAVPLKVWEKRLRDLKKLGANTVRCSHNPQCAGFYDLCDEIGLLCIDELYDKWTERYFQKFFTDDRFKDLKLMVMRDANHPSVILWSMGNELIIQYQEQFYTWLQEMCDACRSLDATRPVSLALIGFCLPGFNDSTPMEVKIEAVRRYGEIVDVFMGNYMESYYAAMREAGMRRAVIGSEVFLYYRNAELSITQPIAVSPWNDVKKHDWVAGGLVWSACDYLGEAATHWPAFGWTGSPFDSAGFMKHRAMYLCSQWSKEPMVYPVIFDERESWDMANGQWSFPQVTAWLNGLPRGKMLHVGVFTNCERVELYVNGGIPQAAVPSPEDGIAHFFVVNSGGSMRAVGYRGGEALCERTIFESLPEPRLKLHIRDEAAGEDGQNVMMIEAVLEDEFGQCCELDEREVTFSVHGAGEFLFQDNGNMTDPEREFTSCRGKLYRGHTLCVIRTSEIPGEITVTVEAEGVEPCKIAAASV